MSMQNRVTDGKKTVNIKEDITRLGASHDMFSQFAKQSTHFLFSGKKRKNILHVLRKRENKVLSCLVRISNVMINFF